MKKIIKAIIVLFVLISISLISMIGMLEYGLQKGLLTKPINAILKKYVDYPIAFERLEYSLQDPDYFHFEGVKLGPKSYHMKIDKLTIDFFYIGFDTDPNDYFDLPYSAKLTAKSFEDNHFNYGDITLNVKKPNYHSYEVYSLEIPNLSGNKVGIASYNVDKDILSLNLRGINLTRLLKQLNQELSITGNIDIKSNIEGLSTGPKGNLRVYSKDFKLIGMQIDQVLDKLRSSRNFGLKDLAGFAAMGPFGLIYTKGYDLTTTIPGLMGGETAYQEVLLDLDIDNHIINANDVAFSSKNLVVLTGGVDLKKRIYNKTTLALVDKKMCPEIIQQIQGPLASPNIESMKAVVGNIIAPLENTVKRSFNTIFRRDCNKYYKGSVKYPSN